jgi:hypothetical protein
MTVSLKVPEELATKAESLIQYLQNEEAVRVIGSKYHRNDVLRMALIKGLAVLEKELSGIQKEKDQ